MCLLGEAINRKHADFLTDRKDGISSKYRTRSPSAIYMTIKRQDLFQKVRLLLRNPVHPAHCLHFAVCVGSCVCVCSLVNQLFSTREEKLHEEVPWWHESVGEPLQLITHSHTHSFVFSPSVWWDGSLLFRTNVPITTSPSNKPFEKLNITAVLAKVFTYGPEPMTVQRLPCIHFVCVRVNMCEYA